jgi:glutamate N-acetyltransferase/amino-acid N-acetyltransferase
VNPSEWKLASGYRFAAVHCGVRENPGRPDLTVVVSDTPAAASGVFTQNRVAAAPVQVSRAEIPRPDARGFVVCAGNANACTGEQGLADARRMTEITAELIGCRPHQMLVASTGIIGRPLPMDRVERGIRDAVPRLEAGPDALARAATGILTTDTRRKVVTRRLELPGGPVTLTGFAKGAAMIGPNMATMLAFILTDASVAPADLHTILRDACDRTFNCLSVEGHTSTNDTVFLMANGTGVRLADGLLDAYAEQVLEVCGELARLIASDAEGASHNIIIDVTGCRSDEEARTVARTVAASPLVKTAVHGADPNWGRIVSAAGYSGVRFEERHLSLWLGDIPLYKAGVPVPFDHDAASKYLRDHTEVHMKLHFTLGHGRCRFYTCDLTAEYVRLNADYTT